MPASILGPTPDVPLLLLEATWEGLSTEMAQGGGGGGGATAASVRTGAKGLGGAGIPAAAAAYQECVSWCLSQAGRLAAVQRPNGTSADTPQQPVGPPEEGSWSSAVTAYCEALLSGSLAKHVLPLVIPAASGTASGTSLAPGSGPLYEVAVQVLANAIGKVLLYGSSSSSSAAAPELPSSPCLPQTPASGALVAMLQGAVSVAVDVLASAPEPDGGPRETATVSELIERLLRQLRSVPPSVPQLGRTLASRLATVVGSRLLRALEGGTKDGGSLPPSSAPLPAEASSLLVSLVRGYGASVLATGSESGDGRGSSDVAAGSTSTSASSSDVGLDSIVRLYISCPVDGAAAVAHADLISSLLQLHPAAAPSDEEGGQMELPPSPPSEIEGAKEAMSWERVLRVVAG